MGESCRGAVEGGQAPRGRGRRAETLSCYHASDLPGPTRSLEHPRRPLPAGGPVASPDEVPESICLGAPRRGRYPPWEEAAGTRAVAGRAAGYGGGTLRPSSPAHGRGPLCSSPPCLLCAAGTGIFHLPALLVVTSAQGWQAPPLMSGGGLLPRQAAPRMSCLWEKETMATTGGRDGADGGRPWKPALPGKTCQCCPASARPTTWAQVCSFPAP